MKKIFVYIWCLISCGFYGCDSILEMEPKNGVTFDHFFRNESDLDVLLRQTEADMRMLFAGVSYQEHMGIKTDRVYNASDLEKIRNLNPNYLTARFSQQQWRKHYNVLSLTDLFFDNYTKVKDISVKRLNFYKGQNYFIRAVCYFTLARTWGDAVITKGSTYIEPYAKSSALAVLDTAIAAAKEAFQLLPSYERLRDINNKKLISKQYGSKGSAAGLLAHLYAWKGAIFNDDAALQQAVEWADRLIEPQYKEEVGTYELAKNAEEVCTKVMGRNSSEGIFEIEVNYTDVSFYGNFFPGSFFISYPVMRNSGAGDIVSRCYGLKRSTVNDMYEMADQRRTAYFYEIDIPNQNPIDLAYLYKWREPMYESVGEEIHFDGMDCNRMMLRLADVYLLRGECAAKLGHDAQAIADLNTIRGLRGATAFPNGPKDQTGDLLWSIFLEREKELLYEGHRYYDAVRNGYYGVNGKHKGVLSAAFDHLSEEEIKNGALYLPVPEGAFKNNDRMIQNTYWMSKIK
ncbi:MAG: RagB/SusD family nutrient uptake outer membrane protein [Odoribacter sp.]